MGVAAVVVVLAYGLLNLSRHPRQQAISKTIPTASLSSDLLSDLDFGRRSPRFGHLCNPFAPHNTRAASGV
jgi:hypothetical protein